jgi:hypothetical protein
MIPSRIVIVMARASKLTTDYGCSAAQSFGGCVTSFYGRDLQDCFTRSDTASGAAGGSSRVAPFGQSDGSVENDRLGCKNATPGVGGTPCAERGTAIRSVVMRWRRNKSRSTADLVEASVEATIERLAENRLPFEDREKAGMFLMRLSELPVAYTWAFRSGYDWGSQVGAFVVLPESDTEKIRRVIPMYEAESRATERSLTLAALFRECMLPPRHGIVTNDDATPFSSPDDAFRARIDELRVLAGESLDDHTALGVFHTGVAFYAFETTMLHELDWQARVRAAEASST